MARIHWRKLAAIQTIRGTFSGRSEGVLFLVGVVCKMVRHQVLQLGVRYVWGRNGRVFMRSGRVKRLLVTGFWDFLKASHEKTQLNSRSLCEFLRLFWRKRVGFDYPSRSAALGGHNELVGHKVSHLASFRNFKVGSLNASSGISTFSRSD